MDKDGVFLTTAVLPLAIKYTVVAKWRSPADGVAGLGGLTVQALCLSGYSHSPPPQPLAQLSLHQGAILWLTLVNGNGAGTRNYYWRDTPSCTVRSLAWCLLLCCLGLRHAWGIMVVRTRASSGVNLRLWQNSTSGRLLTVCQIYEERM